MAADPTSDDILVSGPGPAPFTDDDFRAAMHLAYDPDVANRLADDMIRDGLHRPGVIWVGDILLWIALLSDAHAARVQAYLAWTSERMAKELTRVRSAL